jgi:hypothetical protein
LTFAGLVGQPGLSLKITALADISITKTISLTEGDDADAIAAAVYTALNGDVAFSAMFELEGSTLLNGINPSTIVFTKEAPNVEFVLTTEIIQAPIDTVALTAAFTSRPSFDLVLDASSGDTEITVNDATGLVAGDLVSFWKPEGTDDGFGDTDEAFQILTVASTDLTSPGAHLILFVESFIKSYPTTGSFVTYKTVLAVDDGSNITPSTTLKSAGLVTYQVAAVLGNAVTLKADPGINFLNAAAFTVHSTEDPGFDVTNLVLVASEEPVLGATPETDVICFDYSHALSTIFCFRKGSKQLLKLDPYNASTEPQGSQEYSQIRGNILDMHIMQGKVYVLDDRNTIYRFDLAAASYDTEYKLHPKYKVTSFTGARYTLHDRFTHESAGEIILAPEEVNRLYLLIEDNKVLVYDLNLGRIVLQTSITSDVPVKGIDFYRTFQKANEEDPALPSPEDELFDYTGIPITDVTDQTSLYDVGFLFSLGSGTSNQEWVNRWGYNLFKFAPTTIMLVSGNAIIVPAGTITIYARGLSDQGEVVNDLPIKFTVAGNAGGKMVYPDPETNGGYRFPLRRDGWVPGIYQASDSPPVGSSDTITAIIIT